MEIHDHPVKTPTDFDRGYEKGYHSKDYTWEDGIKYVCAKLVPESGDYKEGYEKGQRDRLRDEIQKWMC
ncbi:MAG: hypothetical protein H7Y13_07640 [Sphingobacteriaceae bacterium]|nr:hypothetical protein [Sphingobacteriaceae bacterium]